MLTVSELHTFSGPKLQDYRKLQIGHLCPDEVLELELDTNVWGDVTATADTGTSSLDSDVGHPPRLNTETH